MVGHGATHVDFSGQAIGIPELIDGASGALIFGVRPENVHLDDTAPTKGRIQAAEYLGTTQIVTIDTAHGQIKARTGSETPVRIGDQTGLRFDSRSVTIFNPEGRALQSVANQRVLRHG
jgi:multiple sugar transport system ATP-binding protein